MTAFIQNKYNKIFLWLSTHTNRFCVVYGIQKVLLHIVKKIYIFSLRSLSNKTKTTIPDTCELYFSSIATCAYDADGTVEATLNSICKIYVTLSEWNKTVNQKKINF